MSPTFEKHNKPR